MANPDGTPTEEELRLGVSLPPSVTVPLGTGADAVPGAQPQVPTIGATSIGEAARRELYDEANRLARLGDSPARMALTGREVTSLDPANRATVDAQLDAASRAAQAKQAIESGVAPAQTAAAQQAVGNRAANIGDYGLSAQQQQARQDELYARADALLRGMEGTHDATLGERFQDMGGSMAKAFGGTDTAQANANRVDASRVDALRALAEQFGRAGTMGATGRTDASKVQELRQAAVDAQLAFAQRQAENAPMEGGPAIYGTDRQPQEAATAPAAPKPSAVPQAKKPKGTPQQQLREYIKKLGKEPTPEAALTGGIEDVMREEPVTAPGNGVASAEAGLEREYPGTYHKAPNPLVTRASTMHTEQDMEKAQADAAKSLAALGHGGLGEKQKFALRGGSGNAARADHIREVLLHSGDLGTAHAITQREGDESRDSAELRARMSSEARAAGVAARGGKEADGAPSADHVANAPTGTYHFGAKKDRDYAQTLAERAETLKRALKYAKETTSDASDRVLHPGKMEQVQGMVQDAAAGWTTALQGSARLNHVSQENSRLLSGTSGMTSWFRAPGTVAGDTEASIDAATKMVDDLASRAMHDLGGKPVVYAGEGRFAWNEGGGEKPAGATDYTPKGTQIKIGNPAAAK